MRVRVCGASLVMLLICAGMQGQQNYSPKNSLSVFVEYAPISGHYVPDGGEAWNRKLVALGGSYIRKLPLKSSQVSWNYLAEVKPVLLLGDPTETDTITNNNGTTVTMGRLGPDLVCKPGTTSGVGIGGPVTVTTTCGYQWTYGQEFSPAGMKFSFGLRHRLQPTALVIGGYQYTDRPVPLDNTGNFNFTIAFGAGFEYFMRAGRSVSFEARVRHFSNAYTAQNNVGTDHIVFHADYRFWRTGMK